MGGFDDGRNPRDLFAGGEKSGLAVQDPKQDGFGAKKLINDILARARAYVNLRILASTSKAPSKKTRYKIAHTSSIGMKVVLAATRPQVLLARLPPSVAPARPSAVTASRAVSFRIPWVEFQPGRLPETRKSRNASCTSGVTASASTTANCAASTTPTMRTT